MTEQARSPISFPVNVARMPQRGVPVEFEADEAQRVALAAIHGLEGVRSLLVNLAVTPWKRHGVRVAGTVKAVVEQTCVATLEPMENIVDERIDAVFIPEASKLGREGFGHGGEIILDPDGPDSPETFAGDWIDVGALAEEFFGLGIDPYPRKQEVDEDIPPVATDLAEGGILGDELRAALARRKAPK